MTSVVPDRRVAIVDYRCGNIASVTNAVQYLGFEPIVSSSPAQIGTCRKIILPGVGSLEQGATEIRRGDLHLHLKELVFVRRVPTLGICLGAQLMLERSEEYPGGAGLGWVAGDVRKIAATEPRYRVPHTGWDRVTHVKDTLFGASSLSGCYYFTHSYAMHLADRSLVAATCEYPDAFDALFAWENLYGCQFHPEKSQRAGLAFLRTFLEQG